MIRHGQASWGKSADFGRTAPLTDLGRRQVAALASELRAREPVEALYTSPFSRAVETAELLSDKLGLRSVVEPRLAEFELEGATIENVEKRLDLLIWRPEHRSASGETLARFCTRVATFCEDKARLHVGERVAVVSHAGTIGATIRWSQGIGPDAPWEHDFEVPNASITELEHWPHGRIKGGAPRYTSLLPQIHRRDDYAAAERAIGAREGDGPGTIWGRGGPVSVFSCRGETL